MDVEDRNKPELLMRRAAMWLHLLCEQADVEPAETTIKVNAKGETVATVSLADDIAALEAVAGEAPITTLADFDVATINVA